MLRIIETTDHKNLGQEISMPSVGDSINLRSGFVFVVDSIRIDSGDVFLSNQNYIIVARGE